MILARLKSIILPLTFFILTFVVVVTNQISPPPDNAGLSDLPMELLFYFVNIFMFISGAFLLNKILQSVIWDDILSKSTGNIFVVLLNDFISSLIYSLALALVIVGVFNIKFTNQILYLLLVYLLLGTVTRTRILEYFSSLAGNVERTYLIGDWISILFQSSNTVISGEVIELTRKHLRLRGENNSLITVPSNLMSSTVITNYSRNQNSTPFTLVYNFDFSVSTRRIKRILTAATKEALTHISFVLPNEPKIIFLKTTHLGLEYLIKVWLKPNATDDIENAISILNEKIIEHLTKSGITPAYPKEDIFYADMPIRNKEVRTANDRIELIKRIPIFETLSENEILQISEKLIEHEYEKETIIIKQNDAGDSMFILTEGLSEVFISTDSGSNLKVGQLVPGDFFGEMSLLTGEKRMATIIASTDVLIYEIPKDAISRLLNTRIDFADEIANIIVQRQNENATKIKSTEIKAESLLKRIKHFFGL